VRSLIFFASGIAITLALMAGRGAASHLSCHTGDALGWATLRPEPQDIVYSMPHEFTNRPIYFESRYNCKRQSVQVRRLGLGTYEVFFPGLNPRATVVTAISEEGVSASYHNFRDGIVRISLRGPLAGEDVASRRDVAFSVVVY